jgi:protein-L-isoaspartate(D-aspartate) O-methyltransferase
MLDMPHARARMVQRQVQGRGVKDERVLEAMREVPREVFVTEEMREFAYEDSPLPIEAGQTISQPYIVARMIEAAEVGPGDHVLEVGAGSGYAAAVISRIAAQVTAIERHAVLASLAEGRLARLGYDNAEVIAGDGTLGWPAGAPYDAILIAAAGPAAPEALKRQLEIGGRLVMPIGGIGQSQRLIKLVRVAEDRFEQEDLGGVGFVPLIGAQGYAEQGAPERVAETRSVRAPSPDLTIPQLIAQAAQPLPDLDRAAFAAPFDRFAEARVVLLGECSHGTSEF